MKILQKISSLYKSIPKNILLAILAIIIILLVMYMYNVPTTRV
jgi:hypothetical protein